MSKLRIVLLATILLPLSFPLDIAAQSRGKFGGAKGADWDAVAGGKKSAGVTLSGGDLEKLSPLKMFISKKKELKLTEAQLAAVTDANSKLMESNAENFANVDTYRKTLSTSGGADQSADDVARTAIARDEMMKTVSAVRASYDAAAKATVDALSAEQQATAEKLLTKHAEELQKTIGEKLGGGGRGGSGRRR